MTLLMLFVLSLLLTEEKEGRFLNSVTVSLSRALHSRVWVEMAVCVPVRHVSTKSTDQDAQSHNPICAAQVSTANSLNALLRESLVEPVGYADFW